jgi:hypothetical protein
VPTWPRDLELLRFSIKDAWTLDDATLGTLITGGMGSGKTSGPFQYVLRSFLRAGFGGIFLCAKKQSLDDCMTLLKAEGRTDYIIFEPDGPQKLCFNFLTYEAQRYGEGKVIIENVVRLLSQTSEIASPSGSNDKFFDNAMNQLLRHCLEIVIAATGKVDLGVILEIVQSLPRDRNDLEDPEKLFSLRMLMEARRKGGAARAHELNLAEQYFTGAWPRLGDKTSSSISITLGVYLDLFQRVPLRSLFMEEMTISPDFVLQGGIVVVNVNIPDYDLMSKFAGVIWKYSVQRAIERRPELITQPIESVRPIFIAVDEAQFWATKSDSLFQTTARANRGLTVYATQNISNFYAEMGSDSIGKARVDSMLGNLGNRFFCQNLQQEMNLWCSESIGKVTHRRSSQGITVNNPVLKGGSVTDGTNSSFNRGWAEQKDYDIDQRVFSGLRRGGNRKVDTLKKHEPEKEAEKSNDEKEGQVEALVVIAGQRLFTNGERWLRVLFDQFHPPPLWMMWMNRKPWAYIVSGYPKSTWWANFRAATRMTPKGLLQATRRYWKARAAEDYDA